MARTKLRVNVDAGNGQCYPVDCTLEHPNDTVVASGHGERLGLRHCPLTEATARKQQACAQSERQQVGDDTRSELLRNANAFGDINDAALRAALRAAQQQRDEHVAQGIRDYLRTRREQGATAADDKRSAELAPRAEPFRAPPGFVIDALELDARGTLLRVVLRPA